MYGTFTIPPQHHDDAHNPTRNHGQSQGQQYKVTLSRRTELGASTKKNHGSLALGRQPSDGQPAHHTPEPRVKPQTTKKNTAKPQRTTVKPQKTQVKPRSCLVFGRSRGHERRSIDGQPTRQSHKPQATSHKYTTHKYHAPPTTKPHNHEATRHHTTPSYATPSHATPKTGRAAPSQAVFGIVLQLFG